MTHHDDHAITLFSKRRAGVLLHISSLPAQRGAGTFGKTAYQFVDFLHKAGFTIWQILPLGSVDIDLSPYKSFSAHAGNPAFIDRYLLHDEGWLTDESLSGESLDSLDIYRLIDIAAKALSETPHKTGECGKPLENIYQAFNTFCAEQCSWLEDYALFRCLRELHDNQPWNTWPVQFAHRDPEALREFKISHQPQIHHVYLEQFLFFRQWHSLKQYAHQHGVYFFGDLPLFVAYDSADVWANPELFRLDAKGQPVTVAGVPPDYFSETGQHWGNPHYDWPAMEADNFRWWIARFASQQRLFDLVRIDHFRGLEAFWEIPGAESHAANGWWTKAPGEKLLANVFEALPGLQLVAENLGVITPDVEALRVKFELAGMAVLQFAFDGNRDNPHLPHQHQHHQVVYTGTHDNDTTAGWFESLSADAHTRVYDYFYQSKQPVLPLLVNAALASVATLAIVPLQDLLSLGSDSRMNTPGTVGNNWQWQFQWEQIPPDAAHILRQQLDRYGRC